MSSLQVEEKDENFREDSYFDSTQSNFFGKEKECNKRIVMDDVLGFAEG